MTFFKYCFTLVIFFSLNSCTNLDVNLPSYDELLRAETGQNGRACVRQNTIRGYGMLEDDVVSINATGKNRYYLVTTLFQCQSLQTTFAAGFKGDFFELCGGSRDKILTSEESCPIKSIFEFESREAAFSAFDNVKKVRQDLRTEAKEKAKQLKDNNNDNPAK
ncbi:DUF6491 family protein [uncultured Paraglaciecola sp.]|uniref:DUF6491 family protein n=1 Tax=uncultured Paraglaciecola sp. TaxID=1765024 RepID=UPI0030D84704|tara:strand:+ start:46775 stop:47263 length:489 start_codon:yes stop_codon:yes gene_type:complete